MSGEGMIAALFVQKNGVYYGLEDVDPWDEERDARKYAGPWPVVAHPPCARWCRLAGLVEKRWGHRRGEDGGMFASALEAVRAYGGVLEHPAWSDAFLAHGIGNPEPGGGWQATLCGGHVCHVEQGRYGHRAKKATWLYAFGVGRLPKLDFRWSRDSESDVLISWCGNHTKKRKQKAERMGKPERSRTPLPFRDLLLSIARSARASECSR